MWPPFLPHKTKYYIKTGTVETQLFSHTTQGGISAFFPFLHKLSQIHIYVQIQISQ